MPGRPIVVKVGGSTLGSHDTTLDDIAALSRAGTPVAVVHGGGAAVTAALAASGVTSRFHNGLRVTDEATLGVLISIAAGSINTDLVAHLAAQGAKPVGLTGVDGPVFLCTMDDPELGFVGTIRETRTDLVRLLLDAGHVPVMAPLGVVLGEGQAQPVNLNADTAAGHLAGALEASALVLLTDTPGVRGAEGQIVPALSRAECERLRESGVITGGMLPKVAAALVALDAGVPAVIADGREAGALPAALAGRAGTRLSR